MFPYLDESWEDGRERRRRRRRNIRKRRRKSFIDHLSQGPTIDFARGGERKTRGEEKEVGDHIRGKRRRKRRGREREGGKGNGGEGR